MQVVFPSVHLLLYVDEGYYLNDAWLMSEAYRNATWFKGFNLLTVHNISWDPTPILDVKVGDLIILGDHWYQVEETYVTLDLPYYKHDLMVVTCTTIETKFDQRWILGAKEIKVNLEM